MPITFAKAVKHEAKGRIALIGPAGSGKSYTMLTAARALAGPEGKIAAIDTEQGSLEKYADLFEFDVCPLADFTAQNFLEALHAAEKAGYAVFCVDSLSHFWMGKGGALEFVDAASARSRNGNDSFSGWKEFRPMEREMTDAMISSPCHVICTMRVKTAYEEQIDSKGKKKRVKIGLAPVQRDGLEYEFDLVGSMTEDNVFVVDKTRCSAYAGKVIDKPTAKAFETFANWLSGAPKLEVTPKPTPEPQKAATETPRAAETIPEDKGKIWAVQFAGFPTVDGFNENVVKKAIANIANPEYGRPFGSAVRAEAKKRGYSFDRTNDVYYLPKQAETEGAA